MSKKEISDKVKRIGLLKKKGSSPTLGSDSWRAFQYSLAEDTALSRLQKRIDELYDSPISPPVSSGTLARKTTIGPRDVRTRDLESSSPRTVRKSQDNIPTMSDFDNISLWDQEFEEMKKQQELKKGEEKKKLGIKGTLKREKKHRKQNSNGGSIERETELRWTSNQLPKIPPEIGKLSWLKICDFSHNQLSGVPKEIAKLTALEVLILSDNRITGLPDEIGELKGLQRLMLDSNHLVQLPLSMGKLESLHTLCLNSNQLSFLPTELCQCTLLTTLQLEENPLQFPPLSVAEEGAKSTLKFLSDMLGTESCDHRMKLLVVGSERCGKSSLVQSLKTGGRPRKQEEEMKATVGVLISPWEMSLEDGKDSIHFNVFDFSGNESLFSAHQFFFSENAIFLIVWDMTKSFEESLSSINYWLHMISLSKGESAPVVIVGTHLDDKKFENSLLLIEQCESTIISTFSGEFTNIKALISTSCTTGKGIEFLRQELEGIITKLGHSKSEVPKRFLALEDIIVEERVSRMPPIISWRGWVQIASKCGILEAHNQLHQATLYLASLGVLCYWADSEELANCVVLDPKWLYECVLELVSCATLRKGILRTNMLKTAWPTYSEELYPQLLEIMHNFQIAHCLPSSEDEPNQQIIVPTLLPKEFVDRGNGKFDLRRQYFFRFLPDRLFRTLMIRLLHLHHSFNSPNPFVCCGKGVVIYDMHGNTATVEMNEKENFIEFSGQGRHHPESLLRECANVLDALIRNWYPTMKVDIKAIYGTQQDDFLVLMPSTVPGENGPPVTVLPFSMEVCERAAAKNQTTVDASDGTAVDLLKIVPDVLLTDLESLKISYKEITVEKELGQGAFGIINKGSHPQLGSVAIKEITCTTDEELTAAYKEWYREVVTMSKVSKHRNVVNMVGFCMEPQCIVMECVPEGTLHEYIQEMKELPWDMRLKIALDIAAGMEYMHSQNPALLHRDLKTPNVLLMSRDPQAQIVAKVADFGLTSPEYLESFCERVVDQPLWLAPEVMQRRSYSKSSDVYAFGVILWELVTCQHPFDEFPFANWLSQLEDCIIAGTRPTIPADCNPEFKLLITSCWSDNPRARPSFSVAIKRLNHIKQSILEMGEASDAPPYIFLQPDTEDTIIKEEYGRHGKPLAKQATMAKLIERMTNENYREFEFIHEFLLTYPMFSSPEEILSLLTIRYTGPPSHAPLPQRQQFDTERDCIRLRIFQFLNQWVEKGRYDSGIYNQVDHFLNTYSIVATRDAVVPIPDAVTESLSAPKERLSGVISFSLPELGTLPPLHGMRRGNSIEQITGEDDRMELQRKTKISITKFELMHLLEEKRKKIPSAPALPKHKPPVLSAERPSLLGIQSTSIAEQSSWLEIEFLKSMQPHELLGQSWLIKTSDSPNLVAYIDWFSKARNWISTEIMKGESPEERALLIEYFIQVGTKFQELNNYNGLMQVLSSLHSEAIHGLTSSWEALAKKSFEQLETLSNFMSPERNFYNYRTKIRSLGLSDKPFIPYLGGFLTDFVYLDETIAWKTANHLINFEKVRKVGNFLRDLKRFQVASSKLNIQPDPKLQHYILTAEIWESADLTNLAQMKEEMPTIQATGSYSTLHGVSNFISGRSNIATDVNSLSSREWDLLLTNAKVVKYDKDQVVFKQGAINGRLYRVKTGKFRVEKNDKHIATLNANAMFGEMSFLGTETSASIIADESHAELWVLGIDFVKKLFSTDADLFRTFYQYLATLLAKRLKAGGGKPERRKTISSPEMNRLKVSEDEVVSEEDLLFRKRFKLFTNEIVIKDYACSMKHTSGRIYLSKQHCCFYSKMFGMKRKKVFDLQVIKALWASTSKSTDINALTMDGTKVKFSFRSRKLRDEAFDMFCSVWRSCTTSGSVGNLMESVPSQPSTPRAQKVQDLDPETLSKDDWEILLQGAKLQNYSKDEAIVAVGDNFQRIYQIVEGECRIEIDGKPVAMMEMGQTFGEISFLLSGGASASVIADSEFVDVYIIEGYFINLIFARHPELAGRFYKYLANELQRRIRDREGQRHHGKD